MRTLMYAVLLLFGFFGAFGGLTAWVGSEFGQDPLIGGVSRVVKSSSQP